MCLRRMILVSMVCLMAAAVPAGAEEHGAMSATGFLNKTTTVGEAPVRYILYVPEGYTAEEAWPLVVFLHGSGERGDNPWLAAEVGIGKAIRENPKRFPALVLMPTCPADCFWDSAIPAIESAMADSQRDYHVDADRIYLTGLSMGGYMTWLWGAQKTDTFAALMPICGGGNFLDIKLIVGSKSDYDFGSIQDRVKALTAIPIYAFHGEKDSVVPVQRTREFVKLVEEAGGTVKYREFPDTDHNSWDKAYGSRTTMEWLLKQVKKH